MKRYLSLWGMGVFTILLWVTIVSAGTMKETRKVSGFDGVVFGCGGKLIITQGTTEALQIEGDNESIASIETEVRQGTLYITRKDKKFFNFAKISTEVTCHLTMKDIREVEISGSGDVEAEQMSAVI